MAWLLAAPAQAAEAPLRIGQEPVHVADAVTRCRDLSGTVVPSSAFGLPTGKADVREATPVASDPNTASPAYCRVRGAIAAVHPADPPILFQVNLPSPWNRRTVQFGGGGLNGVVIEATGAFAGGGGSVPTALSRGYVTYGSDSGHQTPGRSFYDNAQALANYGHEAVKRMRDLAGVLVQAYYHEDAQRHYHIGGSKGGQEGLQAAQRYAADFDGVVAYYPAAQNQSLTLGWNRLWHFAFNTPGGALDRAGQALLRQSVLDTCDALDGAADAIVANTAACSKTFDVSTLLCPDGREAIGKCLTNVQIAALQAAARPFEFAWPMPNGVRSVGPWPVFIGGDIELWFGDGSAGTQQAFYQAQSARPEALQSAGISRDAWQANVDRYARIYDASNPDLDQFRKRAGKLILLQGTTDMLVPLSMTTGYFLALRTRYGADLADFVRYFVVPGYGHGNGTFTVQWDSLAALEQWVESGRAPERPVATDGAQATRGRTRPLCECPTWPQHDGTGDPNDADSFRCAGG